MIGRADIEGSKSNVAMNVWLPQADYPSSIGNTQLAAALYLEDRPHLVARTMVNKSPDQVVGNLFGIINLGY